MFAEIKQILPLQKKFISVYTTTSRSPSFNFNKSVSFKSKIDEETLQFLQWLQRWGSKGANEEI